MRGDKRLLAEYYIALGAIWFTFQSKWNEVVDPLQRVHMLNKRLIHSLVTASLLSVVLTACSIPDVTSLVALLKT